MEGSGEIPEVAVTLPEVENRARIVRVAFEFVRAHLAAAIAAAIPVLDQIEPKSRLQEWAARNSEPAPRYEIVSEGPDHGKLFTATVFIGERRLGAGSGGTKKAAEHAAAIEALASLDGR